MDEGFSPLSMVLFLVFIGLEAAFYGLGSAIQNVSEADLEKDAEEGNKQAKWLLKATKVFRVFSPGSDQCYRSDPGLLCASQLGKLSGAVDREDNRLGCEAGRDPGTDPGGDRDFSGFDQFRYCNS